MIWLFILTFLVSCLVLFWSGSRLVTVLMRIGRFLGWREFVVAFFVMAIAGNLPNLFVGVNAAIHNIPQLSFGEVVGGNLVDLTLAVALAVLIGGVSLPAASRLIQTTTLFTVAIAILPLVLILDGHLGRGDGLVLISVFIFYVFWLFSREERFSKRYSNQKKEKKIIKEAKNFFKDLGLIVLSLFLLLMASQGIVKSAQGFSEALNLLSECLSLA